MTGRKLKTKVFSILLIAIYVVMLMKVGVYAKTPEFRLEIDTPDLPKGGTAGLVLAMVNADGAEIESITGAENFDIASKGTSSLSRNINGDATIELDYNFVIRPKNTGKFTLQGNVRYNGNTYKTNEVQVNVTENDNNAKGDAEEVFVKTLLSNNEIYFGQKTALSYELYSRYSIEDYGFKDKFEIKDFISKEISQDNLKAKYEYIGGNKYVKYEVKKLFISPIKTGKFNIPEYNFQANVITRGGFFNSSTPVDLKTEAKEITVKPLPQANKPADFSGIVGKLKLESKYSRQEVNYGDSINLQITASGNCNLDEVKKIVSDNIPGFSVYQTVKNAEESLENSQYNAKKEFEIILIPEKNGNVKIEPMYVSYFNPESGSYERAEIPGSTITVKGDAPQVQSGKFDSGSSNTKVETVKISQVDYAPRSEGYLTIQLNKSHLLIGLGIFAIIVVMAVLLLIMFKFRRKQDKKLKEVYKQIKNSDNINDVYNLFNNMMKHCFNISLKASSESDIKNRLAGHKIVEPVLEVMNYMEDENRHTDKTGVYLKDKIKDIYRILQTGR